VPAAAIRKVMAVGMHAERRIHNTIPLSEFIIFPARVAQRRGPSPPPQARAKYRHPRGIRNYKYFVARPGHTTFSARLWSSDSASESPLDQKST
jgi:hypothetical protein